MTHKTMDCFSLYNNETISQVDADILTVVYGLFFILIFIPNSLVAWGIYKHKKKRRPLNASKMIFLSLVIMQIFFALIALPYNIYIIRNIGGLVTQFECPRMAAHGFLSVFFLVLCLNATILVCTERNQLITDRKIYRRDFSVSRTRWKIGITFIVAFIWGVIQAVVLAQTKKDKLAAFYTALVVYIGLISVSAVVLSLKILNKVALSMRNSTLSLHNKKNERRLSRTITLIASITSVLFLPSLCSMAFTAKRLFEASTGGIDSTAARTIVWCMLPVYLNFGVNVLVYLIRGGRKFSKFSSIRKTKGSIYSDRTNSRRKVSHQGEQPSRKISGQDSYQQMKKKVSTVSATCEVKGGALVIKEAERKNRTLTRQKTNFGYIGEE